MNRCFIGASFWFVDREPVRCPSVSEQWASGQGSVPMRFASICLTRRFTGTFTDSRRPAPPNLLLHLQVRVVAGDGIEPPTQGFSVLRLHVPKCSEKFASVQ